MQYIPDHLWEFESAAKDMPARLREIQQWLGAGWKLAAWQPYRVSGNWIAGLEFESRHFRLVCDRGYVDVFEITDGRQGRVFPPEDQRTRISPKQVYELLSHAVT